MAGNKRYYWLKLKEDFFEDDTISWLEEQENGKDYVIFYLKLSLKSLTDDGYLVRYVGDNLIPYDVKALAKLTNTPPDTVAVAMKTFIDMGLVTQLDSGEIYMNQINEMIGSETDKAELMRKKRAKDKQKKSDLESGNTVTPMLQNVTQSKSIEKELDLELEKDIELEQENKTIDSPAPQANDTEWQDDFEEWWKIYDKKIGKKDAKPKFKKHHKKYGYDHIRQGTLLYLKTITDKQFQKHPTSFLNAETFNDIEGLEQEAKIKADNGMKPKYGTPNSQEQKDAYSHFDF